jgi:putative tryptophan/tyrosine transport system substrate-binding protein
VRRRDAIALIGAGACAPAMYAQAAARTYRVALVIFGSPAAMMKGSDPPHPHVRAFLQGLRAHGYIEGQNLFLERRSAEGSVEQAAEIMADLIGRNFDVIATAGNESAQAAKRATNLIPIVMATSDDPIAAGIVESLARPGANITGLTTNPGPEFEVKRLQLLKEAAPKAARVAFLGTRYAWGRADTDSLRAAAQGMGLTLIHYEHSPMYLDDARGAIRRDRPDAIFVPRHSAAFVNRQVIAELAVAERLPGISPFREFADAGGLMSYGTDVPELFRRAVGHVDKILRGAKPADLPVEQPTKFELVLNLKAAKSLGLTTPPTLLALADEVIE